MTKTSHARGRKYSRPRVLVGAIDQPSLWPMLQPCLFGCLLTTPASRCTSISLGRKKNRSLGFKDYHYHRRPPHAVSLNINMKQYHLETLEHCTYYKITCYWTSLKFKNNYFQTRIRFFFLQYNTSYDLHFFKHNYAQDARYD